MERALRIATWVSAGLLAAGLMLWLAGAPQAPMLLHAGLWLLIATPIVRVLMALTGYVKDGDWVFAMLTLIVLGCLVVPITVFLASFPR